MPPNARIVSWPATSLFSSAVGQGMNSSMAAQEPWSHMARNSPFVENVFFTERAARPTLIARAVSPLAVCLFAVRLFAWLRVSVFRSEPPVTPGFRDGSYCTARCNPEHGYTKRCRPKRCRPKHCRSKVLVAVSC